MSGAFDRRSVLVGSVALAAASACPKDETGEEKKEPAPAEKPKPKTAKEAFVPVMVAIADRLLPADAEGPGAKAAGIDSFFQNVFSDERLSVQPLLKRGCAFLMKAAQAEAKKPFVDLSDAEKDDLILRLAENQMRPDFHGPTFVRLMLALTLEGFLGDPKHGGNKDQLGWRFVGFSNDGRAQGLALPVLK